MDSHKKYDRLVVQGEPEAKYKPKEEEEVGYSDRHHDPVPLEEVNIERKEEKKQNPKKAKDDSTTERDYKP
ncbi:hypothetical protein B0H94_10779 [Salsuginibacillus halophilus]|uniref:Uncharacterized protein n=1 Tax=Salsuginibacillus halophilus TaxID=517424 RepID=A0A2P8HFV6_9BACI|nr:hypothetical protein [Salsuginibacillus halophilus]PSL45074.1 hypothetical protein B0H94_10779 [Salsuginibacillus halophilus]